MRSHFLGVVGVQHPSGFILLVSCVAEAAALASVPGAGPQRRAVPLQQHGDTTVNNRGRRGNPVGRAARFPGTHLRARSSPRQQPATRPSARHPIGRETKPCSAPSQTSPGPGSGGETCQSRWPRPRLRLRWGKKNEIFVHVWRFTDVWDQTLKTTTSWADYFNDMKPHTLALQVYAPRILEFFFLFSLKWQYGLWSHSVWNLGLFRCTQCRNSREKNRFIFTLKYTHSRKTCYV